MIFLLSYFTTDDHAAPEPNRVGVPNASLTHWWRVLSKFWTCQRPLISRTKRISWPQNLHCRVEGVWNPPDFARQICKRGRMTYNTITSVAIKASEPVQKAKASGRTAGDIRKEPFEIAGENHMIHRAHKDLQQKNGEQWCNNRSKDISSAFFDILDRVLDKGIIISAGVPKLA